MGFEEPADVARYSPVRAADIVDGETLLEVRAFKKERKAAAKKTAAKKTSATKKA